jgi:hypothetical protein
MQGGLANQSIQGEAAVLFAQLKAITKKGRRVVHFPERCHAFSQAHARWRAARSARRKQVLSDEVRRVVVSLHEAGREPTLREVVSRLTTPG